MAFFGADTDISAIHGLIADIFKSCFLLHYQNYNVFYALTKIPYVDVFYAFLNLVFCFIIKTMMYFMP